MLSKCFNPTCSVPFRYLREGRIYHLEVPSPGEPGTASRRREYFWLCGHCCAAFTVVVRDGAGMVQSRFLELVSGQQVEHGEEEKPFLS